MKMPLVLVKPRVGLPFLLSSHSAQEGVRRSTISASLHLHLQKNESSTRPHDFLSLLPVDFLCGILSFSPPEKIIPLLFISHRLRDMLLQQNDIGLDVANRLGWAKDKRGTDNWMLFVIARLRAQKEAEKLWSTARLFLSPPQLLSLRGGATLELLSSMKRHLPFFLESLRASLLHHDGQFASVIAGQGLIDGCRALSIQEIVSEYQRDPLFEENRLVPFTDQSGSRRLVLDAKGSVWICEGQLLVRTRQVSSDLLSFLHSLLLPAFLTRE